MCSWPEAARGAPVGGVRDVPHRQDRPQRWSGDVPGLRQRIQGLISAERTESWRRRK
jgi:hypothetical protein